MMSSNSNNDIESNILQNQASYNDIRVNRSKMIHLKMTLHHQIKLEFIV